MTKNGNDRVIELFWRKGRKQWSIKKAGLQELHFCQTLYMQCQNKRHSRSKDQRVVLSRKKRCDCKVWMEMTKHQQLASKSEEKEGKFTLQTHFRV
jgi:hypothetical protein